MGYRLGVDLGTTFTAAAVLREGGQPNLLGLGNRAMQIPSVFYVAADGTVIVGEVAERRGMAEPDRLVRESKRRIGDSTPLVVSGMPFAAQGLAAKLLRWVVARSTQQMGEPPDHVVVTHPANWGPFKLDLMREVVTLADLDSASLMAEPAAAAAQYAAREVVRAGDTIAVYDLGGGTFDACVLTKGDDGFHIRGRPEGIEHLGGIDFDEAVFQHVLAGLGGAEDLDIDDPEVVVGLARLRRDCVEAKEALSEEVDATVRVDVPGLRGSVRITRGELEALVRPSLLDTHTALRRALRAADVEATDLAALVLVGGASRMPVVKLLLEQELGLTASVDFHPKHDVALGAVRPEARGSWTTVAAPHAATETDGPAPAPTGTTTTAPTNPVSTSAAGDGAVLPDDSVDPAAAPPAPPPAYRPGAAAAPAATAEPGPPDDEPEPAPEPPAEQTLVMAPAVDTPARRPRRGPLLLGLAAVVVLSAGGWWWWSSGGNPDPGPDRGSDATVVLPQGEPLGNDEMAMNLTSGGTRGIAVGVVGDTAQPRVISEPGVDSSLAAISPDRRTLAYVRDVGGVATIWVVGSDGNGARELFDEEVCPDPGRPSWPEPDPSRLVLTCADGAGRVVRSVGLDGSDPATIATGTNLTYAAVSPSGTEVAYVDAEAGADGGRIVIVGTDGSDPRPLTDGVAHLDSGPVWSPDGTRLAIRRTAPDQDHDLAVVDLESGEVDILADTPDNEFAPAWSPDGSAIAYTVSPVGRAEEARIWVMRQDGVGARMLPFPDARLAAPAWGRR